MLIVCITLLTLLIFYAISGVSGAPWVPARRHDVEPLLEDCKLKPGDLFIELGCGDGRFLLAAARKNATVIGYEINPLLWLIAWVRTRRYRGRVRVLLRSFWTANFKDADVVITFLIPRNMERLETKLGSELQTGARFVSYIFKLPGRVPTKKHRSWFIYGF